MNLISGLAAVALVATVVAAPVAPAGAADITPNNPAATRAVTSGATWLKAQLTAGILHNDEYGFDDRGLSADVAFALDAVGGQDATVDEIVDAIETDTASWVTSGAPSRVYAGSLAKMVSLVQTAGQDPRAYDSTDQVARLEGLVASSGSITGRLEDAGVDPSDPWDADFVNVIGQSFAVRALVNAGSGRGADASDFLLEQQCNAGFFRSDLTADKTANEQGCVSGIDVGNIDATALAVINLLETPDASTAAKGAAHLAASWLRSQQAPDGSFSAGQLGTNSNTTGLAGWALAEAGYDGAATKAAGWLRGLQVADLAPCATTLAAANGAIAYKPADLSSARTAGSFSVPLRELARRATAQALPALAAVPAGTDVSITAPATATEKSTVSATVTGLGAGEPACVSLGGQTKQVTGTGSAVAATFTLPAGAATHTFTVTTLAGSSRATTVATATPVTTPTPTTAAPVVGELTASKVERVKKNAFKLRLTCDNAQACAGRLKVRTARTVELPDGRTRRLVMAKSDYTVAPGSTATVRLELTKPARTVLGSKRLRVVATQTARGAEPASTTFWLRRK